METQLRRQIIATFGIAFALIVAMIVIWKLKFYDDVNKRLDTAETDYNTNKTKAAQLPKALKDQAIAKENLGLAKAELTSFQARFRAMNFDLTTPAKRDITWRGYMNEYFSGYGIEVRRQLLRAAEDSGVILNTSLKVDAPPQVPEAIATQTSYFLKPVTGGTLTVDATGGLLNILSFLERVNKSPILMTVGAIKLEGASPEIKATFTLTPYLVAKGDSVVVAGSPAPAPEGGVPGDVPPATPVT